MTVRDEGLANRATPIKAAIRNVPAPYM